MLSLGHAQANAASPTNPPGKKANLGIMDFSVSASSSFSVNFVVKDTPDPPTLRARETMIPTDLS